MRLSTILVLSFVSIALIVTVFGGFLFYQSSEDLINRQLYSRLEAASKVMESQVNYLLESHLEKLEVALIQEHITGTELFNMVSLDPDFQVLFILDSNGIVISSSNESYIGNNMSKETYFINGRESAYISPVHYSGLSEQYVISIAVPRNDSVLVADMEISMFNDSLSKINDFGKTGETILVFRNKEGDIAYFTQKGFFDNEVEEISEENAKFLPSYHALSGEEKLFTAIYDYRNVSVIAATKYMENIKLGIVTKIDKGEISGLVNAHIFKIIIIISAINISLFFVLGILISRQISKHIREFSTAVGEIRNGKYSIKFHNNLISEFSALAETIISTASSLQVWKSQYESMSSELQEVVSARADALNQKISELEANKIAMMNMMEDLADSMEKQKHLESIKTEFLSVTSHELRTPITPIKAQLQMMLEEYFGKITDEQKTSLNMILENALRLDRLIGDILDISKIESGNMKFIMGKADFNDLVKKTVDNMQFKANEKNINIELIAQKIPELIIDKGRIIQVLSNLLSNAIKFTDPQGKIVVEVLNNPDEVLVNVKDSGIGITKEDQLKLFKPFAQVDSSMSRNFEGTGLGLAICKGIIIQHNGRIGIDSEMGKGSTFYFSIPYHSEKSVGTSSVELFDYSKQETLNKFRHMIEKEGYVLVDSKADQLFSDKVLTEEGNLKYNLSFKDMESNGYIIPKKDRQDTIENVQKF